MRIGIFCRFQHARNCSTFFARETKCAERDSCFRLDYPCSLDRCFSAMCVMKAIINATTLAEIE
jgi:hypothetical protein